MKTKLKKAKRPFSVTILAFGVLSFVLLQLTRIVSSIRQSQFLANLPLSISPVYLVLTGVVWTGIGLVNLIGVWRGQPWAARVMWWSVFGYSIFYWLDELMLKESPLRTTNWPFQIILNVLTLVMAYGFFKLPKVERFIGECNE